MANEVKNLEKTKREYFFKKGNTYGKGRPPKELCIPEILRSLGGDVCEQTQKTRLETVLEMVYLLALAGNLDCIKFIAERTEGKVKETLAIETADPTVEKARELLDQP